jgi:hypothetical protein
VKAAEGTTGEKFFCLNMQRVGEQKKFSQAWGFTSVVVELQ